MNICKKCKKNIVIKFKKKGVVKKLNCSFICNSCKNKLKLFNKRYVDEINFTKDLKDNLKYFYSEDNDILYIESSIKKTLEKKIRRDKIIKELNDNKLEFKNNGDIYSFIHYNNPPLDLLLSNLKKKRKVKLNKKIKLHLELKKKGIPLDMSISQCYDYVNNIGCLSLEETVKEIEVEYFLKKIPGYKKLLKKHKKNYAIKLALKNFKPNNNNKKIIDKINKVLVIFD